MHRRLLVNNDRSASCPDARSGAGTSGPTRFPCMCKRR